jgi:hypothetical protein
MVLSAPRTLQQEEIMLGAKPADMPEVCLSGKSGKIQTKAPELLDAKAVMSLKKNMTDYFADAAPDSECRGMDAFNHIAEF